MSHIQINMFGGFHVNIDGRSVDEQLARSPKGVLLMQYLILAPGQSADAKTLMKVMWPDDDSSSPDTALKTLISRQRTLLRELSVDLAACLATVRGGYRWLTPPDVSVDVLEFEEVVFCLGRQMPSEAATGELIMRMLVLYQGRLLQGQAQPLWMMQRADLLHQQFLRAVDNRLLQLSEAGLVHRYVALVRRAIDADPTNEALQQRLIEGLRRTDRDQDAQHQEELSARLAAEYAVNTKDDYYKRVQQASQTLDASLSKLKEELTHTTDAPRAIVCDKKVFKSLFRLQKRSMERTGGRALLGVLTLTQMEQNPEQNEQALAGLVKVMTMNLRRGDVITRLDDQTIAMFLPNCDDSAANIVVDRLKRGFYLQFPSTGHTLSCQVTTITVEAFEAPAQAAKK